uniref:(northern house mosquito) hypothetical protein n=1 Tax=Culex pipiens TaxID=7175 RepID=A0A8D8CKB4_CULPI
MKLKFFFSTGNRMNFDKTRNDLGLKFEIICVWRCLCLCGDQYFRARFSPLLLVTVLPKSRGGCHIDLRSLTHSISHARLHTLTRTRSQHYCSAPADLSRFSSFSFACTTERQWMSCSITFDSRFFSMISVSAMIVLY